MNIHLSLLGFVVVVVFIVLESSLILLLQHPACRYLFVSSEQSIYRTLSQMTASIEPSVKKPHSEQIILNIHFILWRKKRHKKSINRCRMTLRFSNFSLEKKFPSNRFAIEQKRERERKINSNAWKRVYVSISIEFPFIFFFTSHLTITVASSY